MEHTFGSWVEVSIYRNPASSPLSLSMRFDANRANNTRDFGRVSAAFRVSSNLNPCAVFWSHWGLGVGRWSAAGLDPQSSAVCLPQGTATFFGDSTVVRDPTRNRGPGVGCG